MARNLRRHHRLAFSGYVDLSWVGARGEVKYARAKCLDLSPSGLRVEAIEAIPTRTSVSMRAERLNLSGAATVRHVVRRGAKFILGLEVSGGLPPKTLAGIEESGRTPAT